MFFFLKPKFKLSKLPDSKILCTLLFFVFPRCSIMLDEDFPELSNSYWEKGDSLEE